MSWHYTYPSSLTRHLICRWWCLDLTLTLDALYFIWSACVDVKTLHLPWHIFTSLITRWWCPDLTLTLWPLHLIWSVDDDVQSIVLLGNLTLHLICWWWRQHLTLTLVAFHFIWSVDDDIITLHLSLESYTSTDVYMMMSSPYTYLGSPTLYLIYR